MAFRLHLSMGLALLLLVVGYLYVFVRMLSNYWRGIAVAQPKISKLAGTSWNLGEMHTKMKRYEISPA